MSCQRDPIGSPDNDLVQQCHSGAALNEDEVSSFLGKLLTAAVVMHEKGAMSTEVQAYKETASETGGITEV